MPTFIYHAMTLPSDIDGVPVCYFCYDAVDEDGQLLQRDCACRGTDAGFVHLACLMKYAETKSKQARDDMTEFVQPWETCPNCHQDYQNKLAVDIASKFVSFVRRQYPRDTHKQVESLYLKLCALDSMFGMLTPVQMIELGVTANVILSLIDRMKGDVSSLPIRYSQMKAEAYNTHGRIALDEGTEESARRAVVHFGNELQVNEAIGFIDGIAHAKLNIAYAKSKYEGNNDEEVLKASEELYKVRAAELGDEHEHTIKSGKNYATALRNANRGDEARELLTKLLATSKQILGSHHNTTKEIELKLE